MPDQTFWVTPFLEPILLWECCRPNRLNDQRVSLVLKNSSLDPIAIAMLSIHSSPIGAMGTKNTGGMSVVVTETARALGAQGHRVDMYTAARDGFAEAVIPLTDNVRLIHLHGDIPQDTPKEELFHYLPRIYENLESFRHDDGIAYDLIHSHYWLSGRLGRWAQRDWDVPHVITFHTLGELKNALGPGETEPELRMEWEQRLGRSCERVLVATEHEKENQIRRWEVNASHVGIVPFGVNTETFHLRNPSEARRRLDLDTRGAIMLFVGRFVPEKGIGRLLEAVSTMDRSEDIVLLLIGGDGPDAETTVRLKDLSQRLGIGENIRFLGSVAQSELVHYYNAADLLVLPSYYESFGLVVLESLACGTPVVATPVGIVNAVVQNGRNGRIVEDQNSNGIAAALTDVLQRAQTERWSREDIRASISDYTWERVTKTMQQEYMTAMGGP